MIHIGDEFDGLSRVKELVSNLKFLETCEHQGEVDFSGVEFITPLSIAPLTKVINDKQLQVTNKSGYLNHIQFPECTTLNYEHRGSKSFFPIIRITLPDQQEIREDQLRMLTDRYAQIITNNIIQDPEFLELITRNITNLLLTEIVDNISEHSDAINVYVFCQYWPKRDACEICLVDDGIGVLGSLLNANRPVNNSMKAIQRVINEGLSAKNEYGTSKRGTGIRNTIKLLANQEIRGNFVLISGEGGYYIDHADQNTFFRISDYEWNGTIVAMRFRKPEQKVSWSDYIT